MPAATNSLATPQRTPVFVVNADGSCLIDGESVSVDGASTGIVEATMSREDYSRYLLGNHRQPDWLSLYHSARNIVIDARQRHFEPRLSPPRWGIYRRISNLQRYVVGKRFCVCGGFYREDGGGLRINIWLATQFQWSQTDPLFWSALAAARDRTNHDLEHLVEVVDLLAPHLHFSRLVEFHADITDMVYPGDGYTLAITPIDDVVTIVRTHTQNCWDCAGSSFPYP